MPPAPDSLRLHDFDYHLPRERIAQTPVEPRDTSRLLVVHRESGAIEHRVFREIVEYLRPGDLLVANDSRVLPGRLWLRKPTGGRVELLLLRPLEGGWWEALARPAARLRPGQRATLVAPDGREGAGTAGVDVGERTPSGGVRVRFDASVEAIVSRFGSVPLPPYIHAPLADPERYQTVYSRVAGSAAAPTAGLHFTRRLLDDLAQRGVRLAFVTLHVGPDTFRPVQVERIVEHEMHSEFAAVPEAVARAVADTRRNGGRVVAVGTTAVRALESWAQATGYSPAAAHVVPADNRVPRGVPDAPSSERSPAGWSGWTRLFIYPGYRFRAVDALITNFHLPRSTLLMLVGAFAGVDLVRRTYAEAIAHDYRFYSFGDATLIL